MRNELSLILSAPVFVTVLLGGCATMEEPASERRTALTLCHQFSNMQGTASKEYATINACNTDKPNLETAAAADGNTQCNNLCAQYTGCNASTVPPNLRGNALACRGAPPNVYGAATTGPFVCKCQKP